MGTRKVRKNDARRDERSPRSDKVRRTLRDLPSYTEPQDERATNPVILLTERVTALPPPMPVEDSVPEESLEALALLARRSAPPPRTPAVVQRLMVPVAPSSLVPPVAAAAKPSSIPAMTVGGSHPPSGGPNATTSPPRRRSSDTGSRARTLGTVVLSATVGAVVALGMWGVRSGLDRVARTSDPSRPVAALTAPAATSGDNCPAASAVAPSTAVAAAVAPAPVSAGTTAESEPRPVSIDTLPVAGGSEPSSARAASRRSMAATATRASFTSSSDDSPRPAPRPVVQRASTSPRNAVANAVQRASFAARSCETGPQSGKIEVTFAPTGAVSSVTLVKGFGEAGVNSCVLRAFSRVRAATFEGDPVTVRKTVSW